MSQDSLNIVFAEEDPMFRLMEIASRRTLTPEGETSLRYFFGDEFAAPLERLTGLADRLGLPRDVATTVCRDDAALDRALPEADFVILETASLNAKQVKACAPKVRLIQQFGRSVSKIDIATAREFKIPVANMTRISLQSCADHITALVFALARNLLHAHRRVVERRDSAQLGAFVGGSPRNKFNWAGIRNFAILAHSTIGLIGLGENSGLVARRMSDIGMRVLYFKRTPLSPEEERCYGGVSYASLDELLRQSDFVSLHLPYGEKTEKYAGEDFFSKMKRGAYLINTARGGLVDEEALYKSLRSGHLAGAALDVYRYEPVPSNTPLLDLDNVLWTPHISGGEPDYMIEDAEAVLANIARVFNGEPAKGLIS